MKNILFISYSFPPLLLPESIQAARTASALANQGWNVFALSGHDFFSEDYIDKELNKLLDKRMVIYRALSLESRFLSKVLRRVVPIALTLPDNKISWYLPAYALAQKMLAKHKLNLIYSRACPFTSHLVALKLKKNFALPWVAHFSDPWVDSPFMKTCGIRHEKYLRFLESAVVTSSDAIVFVTEEARDLVMKKYPAGMLKKCHVIPHCYDSQDVTLAKASERHSKLIMTFAGNLFGPREPTPLFKALRIVKERVPNLGDKLSLRMVGTMERRFKSLVQEYGLSSIIQTTGMVSYRHSLQLLRDSDLLVLIDGNFLGKNVFFPSKLMDYVLSLKAIVGITPQDSVSAKILRRLGQIVVAPSDIEKIAALIEKLVTSQNYVSLKSIELREIAEYKSENTADTLGNIFRSVLHKG